MSDEVNYKDFINIFYKSNSNKVGNITIYPLTLGHLKLFRFFKLRYDETYNEYETDVDIAHLIFAILICKFSYNHIISILGNKIIFNKFNFIYKRKWLLNIIYRYYRWKFIKYGMNKIAKDFNEYFINNVSNAPSMIPNEQMKAKSVKPKCPTMLQLQNFIMKTYHFKLTNEDFAIVDNLTFEKIAWFLGSEIEATGTATFDDATLVENKELFESVDEILASPEVQAVIKQAGGNNIINKA